MKEEFFTIKPKHPLLQGLIAYYYFHRTYDSSFKKVFTFYPNYRIALNVFKNSEISWNEKCRFTHPSDQDKISSIITFNKGSERQVSMNGCINKIGIVFEPLGLNHFVDQKLENILKKTVQFFDFNDLLLKDIAQQVISEQSLEERGAILDDYFLSRYRPFDHQRLRSAVAMIFESKGSISVNEIAHALNTNRKTLLRLFKTHLAISVKGFSNLVKFRNSLSYFKKYRGRLNLTQLAYESQYYDQASFIKHFSKATGINPKKFFFELKDIADKETTWNIKE